MISRWDRQLRILAFAIVACKFISLGGIITVSALLASATSIETCVVFAIMAVSCFWVAGSALAGIRNLFETPYY